MCAAPDQPADAIGDHLVALFNAGRIEEAEFAARDLTRQHPDAGFGWKALGAALARQANWGEALPALARAAELMADDADTHFNLGLAHHQNQQPQAAEACYLQCLLLKPDYAEAHNNLGLLYAACGQHHAAINHFRQAIACRPDFAQAHNNLGLQLHHDHQYAQALLHFERAIQTQPDYAEAYNNLGATLQAIGAMPEAEAMLRRAIAINPGYASAYNNLGHLLQESGQLDAAEYMLKTALALAPLLHDVHNNLGTICQERKKYREAAEYYQQAAKLNPDSALILNNLGTATQALGDFHLAIAYYQQALALAPDDQRAHSNLLFALNYLSETPPEANFALAVHYGELVAAQAQKLTHWKYALFPNRLRIGIVSGDLHSHPVGYFLENIVKSLNPDRIELLAYRTHHQDDALTQRIRPFFSQWKSIMGLRDAEAAALIHGDGIHVLLDLAGHTAYNRLGVFAYKPAPVQASWLGYFATTGLQTMDYLIADPWTLPETEARFFTEQIWRLPETRLCFTPPDLLQAPSPLPALANGYITFGCFNSLNKLNDRVIRVWADILLAMPASKLMLKAPQLQETASRQQIKQRFADCGIPADRLLLEGPSPRLEYLEKYRQIDIALDPFPFTGGTTSAECLWMGTPLVTLAGERFVSRQGVGLLANAGLQAWIAANPSAYVELAVRHASDIEALSQLRDQLRQRIAATPIFDAPRFATHLEQALWGMWGRFQGQP